MTILISGGKSALDVHLNGTIGTFLVNSKNQKSAGIEVRYLLTHLTLSEKQGQAQLLSMLAPVREVFDLKQLDFDEIMQRDIDDARVSLELIPYLLDSSMSGLVKLFPPIVAIALPLKPNSRVPDTNYRKVERTKNESLEHKGLLEYRITAGAVGEEQFQFFQLLSNNTPLPEGHQLSFSRDNCTLAIVDGQHRAMALLGLYRNLIGGWSDSHRSPYESYYKVWSDKEIRSYDLSELQLPILICTFPQLDGTLAQDIDVVRAARRVFLTLNKTAKKVSDSRNKLLNDQDIVAVCLRATLSYIKALDIKDNTGLRIWNIELDQEGDRVRIASEVAFSGVSHLYNLTEQLLMNEHARGIEARGKVGAPRKRLDYAFDRLRLKDDLTNEQRNVNTRVNYSDEIANKFREKWTALYVPIIGKIFAKFHPFAAFSRSTIKLNQDLLGNHETELEKMLFDGQATSRTFDDFYQGLNRRVQDQELNWTTPEIKETLNRVAGLLHSRTEKVKSMKANRALYMLNELTKNEMNQLVINGEVAKPIRESIDRLFETIFSTVAFQTAVICTYAEAIQIAFHNIQESSDEFLDQYIESINKFFHPKSLIELTALLKTFEGDLTITPDIKVVLGGPTFRQVLLSGELQPAEWPKYRHLLLELWRPSAPKLQQVIEQDRKGTESEAARSLYHRMLKAYCEENRCEEADLTKDQRTAILMKSKKMYEEFLTGLKGQKVVLEETLFDPFLHDSESINPESTTKQNQ